MRKVPIALNALAISVSFGKIFISKELRNVFMHNSHTIQKKYPHLPPVVVGLVDEQQHLPLPHADPLAVLGGVVEVERNAHEVLLLLLLLASLAVMLLLLLLLLLVWMGMTGWSKHLCSFAEELFLL